jgi:hypothetical protein
MSSTESDDEETLGYKKIINETRIKLRDTKKLKREEKMKEYTDRVNDNLSAFKAIKTRLGNLETTKNLYLIAVCTKELIQIKAICISCDYEDTPYGNFRIGPKEAHQINSKLYKEVEEFRNLLTNRLYFLLLHYEWKIVDVKND